MSRPKTTRDRKRTHLRLVLAVLCILAGGAGYRALGYEYAKGYAAGWQYGASNQRDIFFNEMDSAVSLGTHRQMTIWNGAEDKKMKYMFYKIPDSY